ncbi:MAG: SPOR domain-containing protein [Gammaproteobacteria bacterium]|nr:SPOR domain-containing protein [Gammaproteobacteria bacterium]
MVIRSGIFQSLLQFFCGFILLLAMQQGYAGPGFVAGADIKSGSSLAQLNIRFNCRISYQSHEPGNHGAILRIHVESTGICSGVSPTVAEDREQHRPSGADDAKIVDFEYDGTMAAGPTLTVNFSEDVRYEVSAPAAGDGLSVRIYLNPPVVGIEPSRSAASSTAETRLKPRDESTGQKYVINLRSSLKPSSRAEMAAVSAESGQVVFETEALVGEKTWYRLRLGYFPTADAASAAVSKLRLQYPGAWIDRLAEKDVAASAAAMDSTGGMSGIEASANTAAVPATVAALGDVGTPPDANAKVQQLMADARQAMTDGEVSRAVQIYTKILQMPPTDQSPVALEYLGLARERNGQIAHATAEYQRYLATYPDGEGAARVRQRLSALVSVANPGSRSTQSLASRSSGTAATRSPWSSNTFLTQYYRRDVNQLNEQDQVISQSAVFTDVNFDLRRRGERYDFSSRISVGYQHDMLDEESSSGNDTRLSYAYADLADSRTGLRGRLGRQSRNTGGVLGRFDGANLAYRLGEKVLLNTVVGKPVNSTSDGVDDERTFYGLSANYGPVGDGLDLGAFFVQQTVSGMTDRQAVGAEMRYFANGKSLWGMLDYDISYQELGSVFLQGSWRFESDLTLNALIDRRRSPFLSTSNALIGQQFETFTDLASTLTEEELRQLSLDRTAISTTYTLGFSRSLTPRLQLTADASQSVIDATPESGGVPGNPQSTYRYYSTSLLASSLIKEGDVSIIGLRMSDSSSTRVYSVNLDTRYPFGNGLRINPRLRVDYREILSDMSTEWIYTPGLRLQYRMGRRGRIDLEGGKQISKRSAETIDLDRDSYFINFGYQLIFQ